MRLVFARRLMHSQAPSKSQSASQAILQEMSSDNLAKEDWFIALRKLAKVSRLENNEAMADEYIQQFERFEELVPSMNEVEFCTYLMSLRSVRLNFKSTPMNLPFHHIDSKITQFTSKGSLSSRQVCSLYFDYGMLNQANDNLTEALLSILRDPEEVVRAYFIRSVLVASPPKMKNYTAMIEACISRLQCAINFNIENSLDILNEFKRHMQYSALELKPELKQAWLEFAEGEGHSVVERRGTEDPQVHDFKESLRKLKGIVLNSEASKLSEFSINKLLAFIAEGNADEMQRTAELLKSKFVEFPDKISLKAYRDFIQLYKPSNPLRLIVDTFFPAIEAKLHHSRLTPLEVSELIEDLQRSSLPTDLVEGFRLKSWEAPVIPISKSSYTDTLVTRLMNLAVSDADLSEAKEVAWEMAEMAFPTFELKIKVLSQLIKLDKLLDNDAAGLVVQRLITHLQLNMLTLPELIKVAELVNEYPEFPEPKLVEMQAVLGSLAHKGSIEDLTSILRVCSQMKATLTFRISFIQKLIARCDAILATPIQPDQVYPYIEALSFLRNYTSSQQTQSLIESVYKYTKKLLDSDPANPFSIKCAFSLMELAFNLRTNVSEKLTTLVTSCLPYIDRLTVDEQVRCLHSTFTVASTHKDNETFNIIKTLTISISDLCLVTGTLPTVSLEGKINMYMNPSVGELWILNVRAT